VPRELENSKIKKLIDVMLYKMIEIENY